jgi:hypothetical protein
LRDPQEGDAQHLDTILDAGPDGSSLGCHHDAGDGEAAIDAARELAKSQQSNLFR